MWDDLFSNLHQLFSVVVIATPIGEKWSLIDILEKSLIMNEAEDYILCIKALFVFMMDFLNTSFV